MLAALTTYLIKETRSLVSAAAGERNTIKMNCYYDHLDSINKIVSGVDQIKQEGTLGFFMGFRALVFTRTASRNGNTK